MTSIDKILLNASKFDDEQKIPNFIGIFKELYKIPLFKVGLDAILTKAEIGHIEFVMERKDVAERLHGCCITTEKVGFNKFMKTFIRHKHHKIRLQTMEIHVLAHELAHALEKESRLNIRKDFETAFKLDMQNLERGHMMVQNAIKQILFKEIELYDKSQHASEFLARYFELLARSKEIGGYSGNFHFKLAEIVAIFENTTRWIELVFNEALKAQTREHISKMTETVEFDEGLGNFARKERKKHMGEKPKWGKATGSIFGREYNENQIEGEERKKLEEE